MRIVIEMYDFHFAVDYEMIDTRVETQVHVVRIDEAELCEDLEIAWGYVLDTFGYEEMEFTNSISVRRLGVVMH